MLTNLLKTAFRNIFKKFGYSLLNILGLTLGIASALFLIMYVTDELSFDRFHVKADRIVRVQSYIKETDDEFTWIVAQMPFGPQAIKDYPEVEQFSRLYQQGTATYKAEDGKEFSEENVYIVDSAFFDIFTYRILEGQAQGSLTQPNSIVLTQSMARRYFGKEAAAGKTLRTGDRVFTVKAVMEDVPKNSHVTFDGLISANTFPDNVGSWGNFGVFTYLMLSEGTDVAGFQEKLKGMYAKYMASIFENIGIKVTYQLTPITRIHLYSDNAQEPIPPGNIQYVYIFGLVAFFLVLIAALNYINLATARATRRAKEVSLRKVVGSDRSLLIGQFLAESVLLTLFSLLLAIVLISLLLPALNQLSGKSFSLDILYSPVFLMCLGGIVLVVGVLGGSYPAFYLSRFSPVIVMKGATQSGRSGSMFRKILVVVQFTISVAMIVCTLVVFKQLTYLQNKDQGWNMNDVVTLVLPDNEPVTKMRVMKQRLVQSPYIQKVGLTNSPVGEGSPKVIFNMETNEGMQPRGINFSVVDQDFIETLEIPMVSGRDFSVDYMSDTLKGVIVNETLANRLAWDDPIGKKVQLGDGRRILAQVIGVMKDYHQTGMYSQVESLMLLYRPDNQVMYLKLNHENRDAALAFMKQVWGEIFPGKPFTYTFLADRFKEQFGADRNRSIVFSSFTMLALFIACLGLLGLAFFTVERRTREIGIRKVFGASVDSIIRLISRDFLILVGVAIVIALPVAAYLMTNWLKDYVYRYEMTFFIFLWPALITLALTLIIIVFQTWRAANANPVKSLRDE
ncbi:MAG: ABC transporter permease [Bacteroidales bacterium]|jgi:putative ABC transport system permease protein